MLRRRSQAEAEPEAAEDQEPVRVGGKGRPTPKRREAEQARRARTAPPKNRRDAARRTRKQAREQRLKARQALVSGDVKNLPARDAGPVRKFVRDYVDARRSGAGLFLPGALLIFLLGMVPILAVQTLSMIIWLALILVVVGDSVVLVRGIKREVRRRFPEESTRGLAWYSILRAMQIRRLRLPPPGVKRGAKI